MSNNEGERLQKRAQTTDSVRCAKDAQPDKVKAHEVVDRVRAVFGEMREKFWKENPLIVGGRPVDEEEHNGNKTTRVRDTESGPTGGD